MSKWRIVICCVFLSCCPGENTRYGNELFVLPRKTVLNKIPELIGQSTTLKSTEVLSTFQPNLIAPSSIETSSVELQTTYYDPPPPYPRYPVVHAGLPRGLAVQPLPLEGGDHELVFNVSWLPSLGPPAKDYSLEIISDSATEDCRSPICYEYNILGEFNWHIVPTLTNPVAETCSIRPGCAYLVRLIAHPWDGQTVANLRVQLKECEAGVCSCAYAPYLPTPIVQARTMTVQGNLVANISWTLRPPHYPLRLPKDLQKKFYFVSIGKQMVSDAHPSPWFAHAITRQINTTGPILLEDSGSVIVPIERNIERHDKQQRVLIDVKLLARVNLIDDRGCVGPAGNASAYDPVEANKVRIGTYLLWAAFGGTCVLAMIAVLAVSARAIKRVLNALRPPPVSAPLEPLARRPAWFPLQLRTACSGYGYSTLMGTHLNPPYHNEYVRSR